MNKSREPLAHGADLRPVRAWTWCKHLGEYRRLVVGAIHKDEQHIFMIITNYSTGSLILAAP